MLRIPRQHSIGAKKQQVIAQWMEGVTNFPRLNAQPISSSSEPNTISICLSVCQWFDTPMEYKSDKQCFWKDRMSDLREHGFY